MNTQKLNSAITEFIKKKKSNAAYYEENWAERKERKEYYQSFTKDKTSPPKSLSDKNQNI